MQIFKIFRGSMPPDPLESFLCLNQLQISSAEKKLRLKKVWKLWPPPSFSKFLASSLRRDESNRGSLGPH